MLPNDPPHQKPNPGDADRAETELKTRPAAPNVPTRPASPRSSQPARRRSASIVRAITPRAGDSARASVNASSSVATIFSV